MVACAAELNLGRRGEMMTRVIRHSLMACLAVSLLAAGGCKSSRTSGVVDSSPPESSFGAGQHLAMPRPRPDGTIPEPGRLKAAGDQDDGFSFSRTWASATSWLPFGRPRDESGESRALDRALGSAPSQYLWIVRSRCSGPAVDHRFAGPTLAASASGPRSQAAAGTAAGWNRHGPCPASCGEE